MVAQIVSSILGQLESVLTEELKRRGKLVVGAEKDVKKLTSTFSSIEARLLDAEERQLTDKDVKVWLAKLKDVCYKIDDVLDEWRTEILKRQVEDDEDNNGSCLELKLLDISNLLKRVCPFLPSYCFSLVEIGVRYDIASRIKDLYEHLEDIDRDKNMFNFASKPAITFKSLETSSNIKFSDVKGREEETKILKEKLLHVSDHGVRSISIQGTGGLGKTTLAKLLYNDEDVKSAFDKSGRIWVCVSETFDPSTVARTIIKQLIGSDPESNVLSIMLKEISDNIEGKRFLLVLDNVWEGNRTKWEELQDAVSYGSPGSKILVTTRKGEVSRALRCIEDDVLLIGKVSDNVCQAIFTQVAFHGWTAVEQLRLEGLCKDVVNKCDGSPLAAKVLGGIMQAKKSKSGWLKILQSEMWHLEGVREEVFGPLTLSYYDLTPELRQCFQFCAVFPKDYLLDMDQLIKLWISHGFVRARGNQELEDIAEDYFESLASRSFFQDFQNKERSGGGKTYCKMHDLVHDFAQMLSNGECVSMTSKNTKDVTTVAINSSAVLNLRIDYDSTWDLSIDSSHVLLTKDLRSFMANSFKDMESDVWDQLCGIRSLVLIDSRLNKIPSTIDKLIHLRHMDLSFNAELEELPDEICKLYNLWTLIINECSNLKRLPLRMGDKLVNLKHLENGEVPAPLPKSIGRLTRLKTLTEFRIHKSDEQGRESSTIADLKDMNQLQGTLRVVGLSNVADCYEVEQACFSKKASLTYLWLHFGDNIGDTDSDYNDEDNKHAEEVLEAVTPPTDLAELFIEAYIGASISPSWMVTLSNLTRLALMYCDEVKHLPSLGGLRSLEKLMFLQMGKVGRVGVELLGNQEHKEQQDIGAFPRLEVLQFYEMGGWEEWDDDDTMMMLLSPSVMPRLRSLVLDNCYKLKKLPDAILRKPTLQRLEMNGCNMLTTSYMCGGGDSDDYSIDQMVVSEVWDKISHIPTVIFDQVDVRTRESVEMNTDW